MSSLAPHLHAEFAIASMMLFFGQEAVLQIGDRVTPKMMSNKSARIVVEHVIKEVDEGRFVDVTVVPEKILPHVQEVITSAGEACTLAHLDHHIRKLEEAQVRARLMGVAQKIQDRALQEDGGALLQEVVDELTGIDPEGDGNSCHSAATAVIDAMREVEQHISNPKGIMGFDTGWKLINRLTQGQQRKKLWIIAGRPGSGKSLLAQSFADAAMKRSGAKVMIFSMEMSAAEWCQRWVSRYSGVCIPEAIVRKLPSDIQRLNEAASRVAQLPFTICDRPKLSRSNLVRRMRQAINSGCNYFIVDHLGLMRTTGKDRWDELGEISGELKAMAKANDIHVTLLIQLNRKADDAMRRWKEPPSQAHLAEADGPLRDCDVCLMLDLDRHIHVVKNRDGAETHPESPIVTDFHGPTYTFVEAPTVEPLTPDQRLVARREVTRPSPRLQQQPSRAPQPEAGS